MGTIRKIKKVFKAIPTLEGAGVRLKRVFGYDHVPQMDPFLMLDDFHSDNPEDYIKGFPWHPHRGIETITYILHGRVEHGDSMGNKGEITSGDVQWMTAGSGIIHQEMPKVTREGLMWGFQLWANLPATHKMIAPYYQDIKSLQIPEVVLQDGGRVKVICGEMGNVKGPVENIAINPEFLDIYLPPETVFHHHVPAGHTVFAYVIEGDGYFDSDQSSVTEPEHLVLYNGGDTLLVNSLGKGVRFLLVSGRPIGEPVAWKGPIVMNTKAELEIAFDEYHNGTFLKHTF